MKVFVITISDKRWDKYKNDTRYIRWDGVIGKDLPPVALNNFVTMWNAKLSHKQSVAGCATSHLELMKYIIDNKINDVLIIEDDALVDFDLINKKILHGIEGMIYFGGRFQSPVLKKKLNKLDIKVNDGLNTIDTNLFTITGGHGYYFPSYQDCEDIYYKIVSKERMRAIDSEFRQLQKKDIIKHFIYPAWVRLYLPDAKNGFTYNDNSNYKLQDDNKYY